MTRNIRLRKLFSATVALTLALCMLLPTSVFARQEWDGAIVDYDNSGDHLWITNRDDQSQEDVYCIHPTRAYSSKGKNGNYRYRYNLNNNAWLFDNSQRINVNDGIKSDYMLTSANLDRLAKVIYEGQRQNLSYENMHIYAFFETCLFLSFTFFLLLFISSLGKYWDFFSPRLREPAWRSSS